MKFFLLSLSFLVCSITIPNLLKAQDGFLTSDLKEKEKIPEQTADFESPNSYKRIGVTRLAKERDVPPHVDAKILKQMEHERLISEQLLELLSESPLENLVSLEATLVDLKGQCGSSYDRLLDHGEYSFPKECLLFYQVLLQEFVPRAESLLNEAWAGKTALSVENFDQEYQKLKNCLDRVEVHLAQL